MSIPIVANRMDDYLTTADRVPGDAAAGPSNKRPLSGDADVEVDAQGAVERECKRRRVEPTEGSCADQTCGAAEATDGGSCDPKDDFKSQEPHAIHPHFNPFGLNNEPSFQPPTTSDPAIMNPYTSHTPPGGAGTLPPSSSTNLFTVPITSPPHLTQTDPLALIQQLSTPRPSFDRTDTTFASLPHLHSAGASRNGSVSDVQVPLKPFPTDKIPMEIIYNILEQVFTAPVFGGNGRWKDKKGQEEDKVRFVRDLKRSASIYRRFSLVHRSWTPRVLRALYLRPTLTSKRSIEHFRHCLDNPMELWGTEMKEDGTVGGVLGPRRKLVKFITYAVGTGRHSATDYLTYSGAWFAEQAGAINGSLPNTCGWETEGWCSKGCEEVRQIDFLNTNNNIPEGSKIQLHRLNILRAPVPADVFHITMSSVRNIRALELLDVQPHMIVGDSLIVMKRTFAFMHTLEMMAMRVDGAVLQEGIFDDILDIRPTLKYLQVQADLLSAGFFNRPRARALESLLIGFTSTKPLVFNGKEALDTLWMEAQRYYAFQDARRSITLANTAAANRETDEQGESSSNGASGSSTINPAAAAINSYPLLHERSAAGPVLGLESWLLHELNLPDSPIAKAAITGDEALALADAWCYHNTLY